MKPETPGAQILKWVCRFGRKERQLCRYPPRAWRATKQTADLGKRKPIHLEAFRVKYDVENETERQKSAQNSVSTSKSFHVRVPTIWELGFESSSFASTNLLTSQKTPVPRDYDVIANLGGRGGCRSGPRRWVQNSLFPVYFSLSFNTHWLNSFKSYQITKSYDNL